MKKRHSNAGSNGSGGGTKNSSASSAASPSASTWQEPEVAPPKPSMTGHPLGSGPPPKLLKKKSEDSTIPRFVGNGSGSGGGGGSSSQSEVSSQATSPTSDHANGKDSNGKDREAPLKIRLKTGLYNSIVKDSKVRKSPRAGITNVNYSPAALLPDLGDDIAYNDTPVKRSNGKRSRSSTPAAETSPMNSNNNEKSKLKRIKITASPKKSVIAPRFQSSTTEKDNTINEHHNNSNNDDTTTSQSSELINNDFCSACGGFGKFLCCETCPKSFHFSCTDPPYDEDSLPEGEWHCKECYAKKHPPKPFRPGIWSQLLNQLELRNPLQYLLPTDIRERYEGVLTTEFGEYEIEHPKPSKYRKTPSMANELDSEPLKTLDKWGNPILCHKCKESGLNGVPMLNCEYCSLSFHADCVNPPVIQPVARGWKCPNHADQVPVTLPRRAKRASYEIPSVSRRFKNNGNIEILEDNGRDNEVAVQFYQEVPPIFSSMRETPTGIAAKQKPKLVRNFMLDDVVYRLPEESIKLDFIESIEQENSSDSLPETNNAKLLTALDEVATKNFREREAVRNICNFQYQNSAELTTSQAASNLSLLVDAALNNIDVSEREQLLSIQRLLRIKGRDKLLEFLEQ